MYMITNIKYLPGNLGGVCCVMRFILAAIASGDSSRPIRKVLSRGEVDRRGLVSVDDGAVDTVEDGAFDGRRRVTGVGTGGFFCASFRLASTFAFCMLM